MTSKTATKIPQKRSKTELGLQAQQAPTDRVELLMSLCAATRHQLQTRQLKGMSLPATKIEGMIDTLSDFVQLSKREILDYRRNQVKARRTQEGVWFILEFVDDTGTQLGQPEFVQGYDMLAELTDSSPNSCRVSISKWENYKQPFARLLQPMAEPPYDYFHRKLYPCVIMRYTGPQPPDGAFIRTENPRAWVTKKDPDGKLAYADRKYLCKQVDTLKKSHRETVQLYLR